MKKNSLLLKALVTVAVVTGILLVIVRRRNAARHPFRGANFRHGSQDEFDDEPSNEDIARLALLYWEEEGHPEGRAEEHWRRAEEQLRHHFSDSSLV